MVNVVFLVAIGDKSEYTLCKQSWKRWCDKNSVELVVLDQEVRPKEEMFYNFQRYYMFELLDNMGIDYDGEVATVSFNPRFLLDPLKSLQRDKVCLEFRDDMSPGVFRVEKGEESKLSFLCVVMPIRTD